MYSLELDPISQARIKMKLYHNVTNVPELRQQLITGKLQCCLIKASLIIDPLQVVVAANKACTSEKLKTRTVYTEILFNLSVSKNITQSLQTFGANDKDTDVLVAIIEKNNENHESIFEKVQGEEGRLDMLKDVVKLDYVKQIYKISDAEMKNVEVLDSVVSKIAAKDCIL